MEIITGRTGQPHVYAADDAEIYKLFLGDADFVLQTGNKLNAAMYGTNAVRIYDGSLIMQGRLAKIRPSDGYDELSLDVGTTGYKRVDLIVAEYNQTVTENQIEQGGEVVTVRDVIESVELKVVKGTPNANSYVEPTVTTGNIDAGETHQMKLWAVRLNGINFDGLIDYRDLQSVDTTPIQTAITLANSAVSQIEAQMAALQSDIYDYADELRQGITSGFSGCWKQVVTVTTSDIGTAIQVTMPNNYVYASTDVVEIYLEGLRLINDEYQCRAGASDNILSINLGHSASDVGGFTGQMEVVVFKLAEEQS